MSLWLWHLFGNFIRSPHRLFVSSTRRLKNSRVYSTMCSVVDMLSVPGTTFQMKGSMLELCFLDYNGLLIPVEAEVWCDGRDPTDRREKRKFSSPFYQLLGLDLCWPMNDFIMHTNFKFHRMYQFRVSLFMIENDNVMIKDKSQRSALNWKKLCEIEFDPFCLHWSCSPSSSNSWGEQPKCRQNGSNLS